MDTTALALEIKVISGEGLRLNRRQPVKKNAFVLIRTDSINSQTTKIDTEGGSYPTWNQNVILNMPLNLRNITVQVQCKTYSGNKVVGTARIPVSDFVGGFIPANYLHFLSYRLRDGKGERNGIINLSVRVKANDDCAPSYSRVNAGVRNDGCTPGYLKAAENGGSNGWRINMVPNSSNYPSSYSQRCTETPAGGRVYSGVVTGVPIWHTNQL
ncbi:hypothetical protein LguiA_010346 [Lonicera macranthoides]